MASKLDEAARLSKSYPEASLPKLTPEKLKQVADDINPEDFSNPYDQEIVIYVKAKLINVSDKGKLELLGTFIRRDVERSIARKLPIRGEIAIADFTNRIVGTGSWYTALAKLIKDRVVMAAILDACNIKKGREKILSWCDPYIVADHEDTNGYNSRYQKEYQRKEYKKWAEGRFGHIIRHVLENGLGEDKDLSTRLTWRRARYLFPESRGKKFECFCETFGGKRGEEGWYQAIKEAFDLPDELITQIRELESS